MSRVIHTLEHNQRRLWPPQGHAPVFEPLWAGSPCSYWMTFPLRPAALNKMRASWRCRWWHEAKQTAWTKQKREPERPAVFKSVKHESAQGNVIYIRRVSNVCPFIHKKIAENRTNTTADYWHTKTVSGRLYRELSQVQIMGDTHFNKNIQMCLI